MNEEGLPIIEITEPVSQSSEVDQGIPSYFPEPDLLPLNAFSLAERERRRRERDRILDMLEEEERLQKIREEHGEEEGWKENIRKRKEEAKAEYVRLIQAKDLQQKMARALVGGGAKFDTKNPTPNEQLPSTTLGTHATKKTVTFADDAISKDVGESGEGSSANQIDWGDITAGRLRSPHPVTLVSAANAEKTPMKTQVVERRVPGADAPILERIADSDDESFPPGPSSPEQGSEELHNDEGSCGCEQDSDEDGSSNGDSVDSDLDWDSVQHQREVALEYLSKRHTLGAAAAMALANCSDEGEESVNISVSLALLRL